MSELPPDLQAFIDSTKEKSIREQSDAFRYLRFGQEILAKAIGDSIQRAIEEDPDMKLVITIGKGLQPDDWATVKQLALLQVCLEGGEADDKERAHELRVAGRAELRIGDLAGVDVRGLQGPSEVVLYANRGSGSNTLALTPVILSLNSDMLRPSLESLPPPA